MHRILVACEFSGRVREAFRRRGHDAWSCDLLPSEDHSRYHIQGDVLDILSDGWDMMIAHPPCTYLCNSGVRWLHERPERWKNLEEAAEFFKTLLNAPIERICIENPIPHRYAVERIGRKYDQIIQPWMFGDNESKATCLWLRNLPLLKPSIRKKPKNVEGRIWKMWNLPQAIRWKERSRTYPGIADAMAEQFGFWITHSRCDG